MEVSLLLCTFLAAGSKSRGNNDVLRRSHQLQYKISWYDVMLVFRGRESRVCRGRQARQFAYRFLRKLAWRRLLFPPKFMHSSMMLRQLELHTTSQHSLEKAWKMKYLFTNRSSVSLKCVVVANAWFWLLSFVVLYDTLIL